MSTRHRNIRKLKSNSQGRDVIRSDISQTSVLDEMNQISMIPPSINSKDTEMMNWDNRSHISFMGMIRINSLKDGSDYFHSILAGYHKDYMTGTTTEGNTFNRTAYVSSLRRDLAEGLKQPESPSNPHSLTKYDKLSNGRLSTMALTRPEYKLDTMMKKLASGEPIGLEFHEYVSNQLNKDIYVLDLLNHDVLTIGMDISLLYKNRNAVVIVYSRLQNCFDTVGIINQQTGTITTFFDNSHPFIKTIRKRISSINSR